MVVMKNIYNLNAIGKTVHNHSMIYSFLCYIFSTVFVRMNLYAEKLYSTSMLVTGTYVKLNISVGKCCMEQC